MRKKTDIKRCIILAVISALIICSLLITSYADKSFSLLDVEQRGENFVYIEWSPDNGADGYSVYRATENGPFQYIKSVSSCDTFNYGLTNGTDYSYRIRSYTTVNGNRQYRLSSNELRIHIGVAAPCELSAKAISKNSATISWTGDDNADGYTLYRSYDAYNWVTVKRISETSTTTYGLLENRECFFKLKAYRNVGGVERYSVFSDVAACRTGLESPKALSAVLKNANTVELSWCPVPDAEAYRIYRSRDGGEYSLVKTVSESSTKNYSLTSDAVYSYKVAAVAEVNGVSFKSDYSNEASVRTGLDTPQNVSVCFRSDNSAYLKWNEVEGATAYRIYRKDENEPRKLIKTVSETNTVNYGLKVGDRYEYCVKAIYDSGGYTVNSSESEVTAYYHASLPSLSYSQQSVNSITLTWNRIVGADGYIVYRISTEDGLPEKLCETSIPEAVIPVDREHGQYCIAAEKDGFQTGLSGTIKTEAIVEDALSFSIVNVIDPSRVVLAWEPTKNAVSYEIARSSEKDGDYTVIGECSDTVFEDNAAVQGTTCYYKYRIKYSTLWGNFCGNWSSAAAAEIPKTPQYRALLIGEENYTETLHGTGNDVEAMKNMLCGLDKMDWEIYAQTDAEKEEIISLIDLAFRDAQEGDVSLFYYSGHGIVESGDYYSGALMTVDYNYIPTADLAELLSKIPGKLVVILDSCGSGAAIYDGKSPASETESAAEQSIMEFNSAAIKAFSSQDTLQTKSGELRNNKFYVLTSSAYEQISQSVFADNIWGGALTRSLTECVGYDFNTKMFFEQMPGDLDKNGIITLNECYLYCSEKTSKYQNVQVYPENSSFDMFIR